MAQKEYLYMMLLGCKPAGRLTEQHDIYFAVGANLIEAAKNINLIWPEAKGDIHIDAWRRVTKVGDSCIEIIESEKETSKNNDLFFVNLGGYKAEEFEERHFKVLLVAENMMKAKKLANQASFFNTHIFPHIDDKFAIDLDDIFSIPEYVERQNPNLRISITAANENATEDPIQNGYFQLHLLKEKW